MNKTPASKFAFVVTMVTSLLFLSSCLTDGSAGSNTSAESAVPTEGSTGTTLPATPRPIPVAEPGAVQGEAGICDPLNSDWDPDKVTTRSGLIAQLSYVPDGSTSLIKNVDDVFRLGTPMSTPIFLNQVNVPTRSFSTGFGSLGHELKSASGVILTEYFGLRMHTVLSLPNGGVEGFYQFALVSDDGAVLKLDENGRISELVNNDGTHATQSACSTRALYVDKTAAYKMNLDYHQGPADRIAVQLLWRLVPSSTADASAEVCATTNDEHFYDNISTSPYQKLVSMGFKPVPNAAFNLPASAPSRRCL